LRKGFSRRSFLNRAAILPIAARFDFPSLVAGDSAPRVVVIGSGAFGSWTAFHLQRLGAKVTLIDAWGAGNTRSSSGGETRVIRAIYGPDRIYVEMVKRAYELWEALDASTDEELYVETGALWMHRGDDSYVRSSLESLAALGFPVETLSVAAAKKRYPQIDFGGVKSIYLEKRAGALSAQRSCIAVRDAFVASGGTYRTAHVDPGDITNGSMSALRLGDGSTIEADAYVFACGPWMGKVFPEVIGDSVRATKQDVLYFGTPRGSKRYVPSNFPVWIDFGERIMYGIPDIKGRGFKVADDTRGEPFDPTDGSRVVSKESVARARALFAERFPELKDAPLLASEVCQYENSPDGHLIVDRHPQAKNAILLGGGSGHGFKLSPAVGEMAARLIVSGKETPKLFRLDRLRDAKKPATQFDAR